jgi:hypothetical protein
LKILKPIRICAGCAAGEYRSQVPSEAFFSRAFNEFAVLELPDTIQNTLVAERLVDKIVRHNSLDSRQSRHGKNPVARIRRRVKPKRNADGRAKQKKRLRRNWSFEKSRRTGLNFNRIVRSMKT